MPPLRRPSTIPSRVRRTTPRTSSSSSDPNNFVQRVQDGAFVKVQKTSRESVNGQTGMVLQFHADRGRYKVLLCNTATQEVISLKPENLRSCYNDMDIALAYCQMLKHSRPEIFLGLLSAVILVPGCYVLGFSIKILVSISVLILLFTLREAHERKEREIVERQAKEIAEQEETASRIASLELTLEKRLLEEAKAIKEQEEHLKEQENHLRKRKRSLQASVQRMQREQRSRTEKEWTYDADSTGSECVVCHRIASLRAVIPCGHQCLCDDCAHILTASRRASIRKCPLCRGNLEKTLKIYTSH